MALHTLLGYAALFSFVIAVVIALLALFLRKGPLNLFLLLSLAFGCLMIFFSIQTGSQIQTSSKAAMSVLQEHSHLAGRVQILGYIAGVLGLIQVFFAYLNPGRLYRALAFITLAVAIATSLILLQVMRTGHELVYKHGVGVERSR